MKLLDESQNVEPNGVLACGYCSCSCYLCNCNCSAEKQDENLEFGRSEVQVSSAEARNYLYDTPY
jgi:hypothetical protein